MALTGKNAAGKVPGLDRLGQASPDGKADTAPAGERGQRRRRATPKPPKPEKAYIAPVCEPDDHLPPKFVKAIKALEQELKMPVLLLIQGDEPNPVAHFGSLDAPVLELFVRLKAMLPEKEVALVIDSPGGDANTAYRLAMLLRRRCGDFTAVVPRWAKSAATLLSIGAKEILLGEDAQLGPLDVQIYDSDKEEEYTSALNEQGAIQELEEAAIGAASGSLFFMQQRTHKRLNALMPVVFDFVAKLHQPLFDKIDAVRFSKMCRLLRIAEQYAVRLLQPRYSEQEASLIARDLVNRYPSHRFVIDKEECERVGKRARGADIGLRMMKHNATLDGILDDLYTMTGGPFKAIGWISEAKP